jgi:hypothetical protein
MTSTDAPSSTQSPTPTQTETSKEPTEMTQRSEGARSLSTVDNTNPFVYVNDQNDNYNAELALAMASRGFFDLQGFLFSYSGEPWLSRQQFQARREEYRTHHMMVRERAVQSEFENLPPAEVGVVGDRHQRPSSGAVEDTSVVGSTGTDRIVNAARAASPDRPLVVAVGSDLCTVADAYLTDPSIAGRTVVFVNWTGSPSDPGYNIMQSGWSASIVLQRLSTVLVGDGAPLLRAEQVRALPDKPLRRFMLRKEHGQYGSPLEGGQTWDGDSRATLAPAHPETRVSTRSAQLNGLVDTPYKASFQVPNIIFGEGEDEIQCVAETRGFTEAFWSHFEDSETWN